MRKIDDEKHDALVQLRKIGNSIPEISKKTGVPITTVQRHIKDVQVPVEYKAILREKQGGSKERAAGLRENSLEKTRHFLGTLSDRDKMLLLIGLYWGEGTKKDFAIINSDPALIQTFIHCLQTIGISRDRITMSLRIHSNISVSSAKAFWSGISGLSATGIGRIEIIEGKKKGKLKYGMCRIRVRSGIRERLLIQSAIALIGKEMAKG